MKNILLNLMSVGIVLAISNASFAGGGEIGSAEATAHANKLAMKKAKLVELMTKQIELLNVDKNQLSENEEAEYFKYFYDHTNEISRSLKEVLVIEYPAVQWISAVKKNNNGSDANPNGANDTSWIYEIIKVRRN